VTLIAALTKTGEMPAFVNISRVEGGGVAITLRTDGEEVKGSRVCGQTCYPGGSACNNYCRGQAKQPAPHHFTKSGTTARAVFSDEAWAELRAQIMAGE
jgi:hypothetical protein